MKGQQTHYQELRGQYIDSNIIIHPPFKCIEANTGAPRRHESAPETCRR